jgi:hypothetical protein
MGLCAAAQLQKAHRPACASRFQECFPVPGPSVTVSDLSEGRAVRAPRPMISARGERVGDAGKLLMEFE